eukprot:TRINITY_DN15015_c0_g1_i1.p1 TRINITY_DN15015_c0_g1~~TRINITY_DN15015_c0_g1_i1.p1  ORF type:complete len:721 (-),score=170.26 TRINITY_DN15015_c0_g1_i1:122-2284(-)
MNVHVALNVGLALLALLRLACWGLYTFWHPTSPSATSPPPLTAATASGGAAVGAELRPAGEDVFGAMDLALARCQASVLAALLADAVARGVQSRYVHGGFVAPEGALDASGVALKDLYAALRLTPAADDTMGVGNEVGEGDEMLLTAGVGGGSGGSSGGGPEAVGQNTHYGEHLVAVLRMLRSDGDQEAFAFDFVAFQRSWHAWQAGLGPHAHRGLAAEITLKNLERGLAGRHAAALVGDVGAVPRLLALFSAFALQAARDVLLEAGDFASVRARLEHAEESFARAARELCMVTHDRAEAVELSEFLARVAFRLAFRETLLPPAPQFRRHPLDRHSMPSLLWRAAEGVQRQMAVPFLRRTVRDAERLCRLQMRRAPLGGELGGTRYLDAAGDLADLGRDHTSRLPTPQSDDRQRELFGLSGGVNAALPAVLYLAWKYEQHPAAAFTANALLGGNAAGRGVMLGLLLGARAGSFALPQTWLAQLRSAEEVRSLLSVVTAKQATASSRPGLRYAPCSASLCGAFAEESDVVTSQDVRVRATVIQSDEVAQGGDGSAPAVSRRVPPPEGSAGDLRQLAHTGDASGRRSGSAQDGALGAPRVRRLVVRLNVSNEGVTGLPICLHGDAAHVADRCLRPGAWASFHVDASSGEVDALLPGEQSMVGLLEVLRPLPTDPTHQQMRLAHKGVGNLLRASLAGRARGDVECEHFAAKIGRFAIPTSSPP